MAFAAVAINTADDASTASFQCLIVIYQVDLEKRPFRGVHLLFFVAAGNQRKPTGITGLYS